MSFEKKSFQLTSRGCGAGAGSEQRAPGRAGFASAVLLSAGAGSERQVPGRPFHRQAFPEGIGKAALDRRFPASAGETIHDRIDKSTRGTRGIARIHVILMALCAVLLAAVLIPAWRAGRYHAEWLACAASLRVVNGALIVEYLDRGEAASLRGAEDELVRILPGRDGYCPSGGTVYFLKEDSGDWKAVCGMHDSDHALRTRLNAAFVLEKIKEEILRAQQAGGKFPEAVTVELNSRTLTCLLVEEETGLRRGTGTTKGYEGTVAYYGLAGYGAFGAGGAAASDAAYMPDADAAPDAVDMPDAGRTPEDSTASVSGTGGRSGAAEGEICYFCFADEDYNACWRAGDGWTGSSYGDSY